MIKISNQNESLNYKILILDGDEATSHCNSKLMQLFATVDGADHIIIADSGYIENIKSYKCIPDDFMKQKALYEGFKYKCLYENLKITVFPRKLRELNAEKLEDLFSVRAYEKADTNLMIITSSNTPINLLEDLQNLHENHKFNILLHFHLETGNVKDGGYTYTTMSKRGKFILPYPQNLEYLDTDQEDSNEKLAHCSLAGGVLALAVANAFKFNTIETYKRFSTIAMSIGQEIPTVTPLEQPIQLLPYEKIHYIFLGTGATGSFTISETIQALAQSSNTGIVCFADGDLIESKNSLNQRWLREDINKFKVEALANRYKALFPHLDIRSYSKYLYNLDEEVIKELLGLDSAYAQTVCLVASVDNLGTRKLTHNGFIGSNNFKNLIYLDSGNGTIERNGQTVIGYKQYDKIILEPVATSGIDRDKEILNSSEDVTLLGSCTQFTTTHPQNITTNIMAAMSMSNYIFNLINHSSINAHASKFFLEPHIRWASI